MFDGPFIRPDAQRGVCSAPAPRPAPAPAAVYPFGEGEFGFGTYVVQVSRAETPIFGKGGRLSFDGDKLPAGAVFRLRKEGDVFQQFGGGTKKLKDFLIDKKLPQRERDLLPVLACGTEI